MPESSAFTWATIWRSCTSSSCRNFSFWYFWYSISRNLCSHWPVSSGLTRSGVLMKLIRSIPVCVAIRFLPLRTTYPRLSSVSMIPARDDGLPMPFSFMASRSFSSLTSFPAVSIARSKVASVKCFGAVVHFSVSCGLCSPWSPCVNCGSVGSFSSSESSSVCWFWKRSRHPGLRISFPVALNGMELQSASTVVVAYKHSG